MSLQQYVRQLKPRNEFYTPPVEKVQTFLAEGKGAATYFEGVIAACHNLSNQKEKDFKKKEFYEIFNISKSSIKNVGKFIVKNKII